MIKFLGSKTGSLVALMLALVAQLPHAAEVFMRAGNVHGAWAMLHGGAYALALELATLIFVVQGQRGASYVFAVVSVLVNLSYYSATGDLFAWSAFSDWLISFALPVAIALYSHAVAGDSDDVFDVRAWWAKVRAGMTRDKVTSSTVHPVLQPIALPVAETVHNEPDDAQCTVDDIVQDGAPSKEDKPAYARWLKMEKGMTNAAIADVLEVHRNTVGGWLNGAHKVAS